MKKKKKKKNLTISLILSPLASDTPCKLDILGMNGDSFGMNGAQVGVLEEPDQVSLGYFF